MGEGSRRYVCHGNTEWQATEKLLAHYESAYCKAAICLSHLVPAEQVKGFGVYLQLTSVITK